MNALNQAGRLRLLEIYEREGFLPALVEGAAILDGEGLEKYGVMGWLKTDRPTLIMKARRHLRKWATRDESSGRESSAHAFIRCLQICALRLAVRAKSPEGQIGQEV